MSSGATLRPDWRTVRRHRNLRLSYPTALAARPGECPCGETVDAGDEITHVQHLEDGEVVSDDWHGPCCYQGARV